MKSHSADVNGITMRWEEIGSGDPLILLHGIDRKSTRLNSSH